MACDPCMHTMNSSVSLLCTDVADHQHLMPSASCNTDSKAERAGLPTADRAAAELTEAVSLPSSADPESGDASPWSPGAAGHDSSNTLASLSRILSDLDALAATKAELRAQIGDVTIPSSELHLSASLARSLSPQRSQQAPEVTGGSGYCPVTAGVPLDACEATSSTFFL